MLDLGVSGSLYRDALVFYDRETGSYWSQVTGEALRGPLAGKKLAEIPSVVTTWAEWKKAHPDTLVLRAEPGPRRSAYADYISNPEKLGVLGTKNPDARLPGKTWVWGIATPREAVAVVEERVGEEPRELRVGDLTLRVHRKGDRLIFAPEGSVTPRRVYWYVWARFYPGSRLWPEERYRHAAQPDQEGRHRARTLPRNVVAPHEN